MMPFSNGGSIVVTVDGGGRVERAERFDGVRGVARRMQLVVPGTFTEDQRTWAALRRLCNLGYVAVVLIDR